ncbi:MAG: acetyl-CoA hydrolase/transferase family protein [Blautia sp.]|nr:acetyl-CoA hydrolase/transferase family protein [Blautia sp.]
MNWIRYYKEHLVSAEEALLHIKDHDRVFLGHVCAEPEFLINEMVRLKEHFHDVELVQMLSIGEVDHYKPELQGHFRINSLFAGGNATIAMKGGYADFTPVHFSRIPLLFRKALPLDVAIVVVTPPDAHGKVSLGVSVDCTKAAVKSAKMVIAMVNDQMPYTMGESTIDVERIDFFVEHSTSIHEVQPAEISEVFRKIGQHCASLVKDGDTIQLGIGELPNAVLEGLRNKKHIGIHTEMFSDGVMKLMKAGVIDNSQKVIHKNKVVTSFLMGTKELYDFVDKNDDVHFYSIDYVNNSWIIAQNDHFVSINSCIEVDLMGQVASENIGFMQISGTGGQLDFIRGAAMAEHGISVIAMPSTTKDGKTSKIVSLLKEGATVTTGRADVDYIITEYGIARMQGRTLKQRACGLIQIAHPDFREGLIREFERRFSCTYEEALKSC